MDGVDATHGRGSHSGRKGKRARTPPLLVRPFTSVAPEEASRRAEATKKRAAIPNGADPAPARRASCARVPRGPTRSRAGAPGGARGRRDRVRQDHAGPAVPDRRRLAGRGRGAAVMCTQPRRILAVTVSERVAAERGEQIGVGSVGYQIRLESKAGPECALLFCTNGVLLRRLHPAGRGRHARGAVAHRGGRDPRTRPVRGFPRRRASAALQRHPHLRLVLMSATVREDLFSSTSTTAR